MTDTDRLAALRAEVEGLPGAIFTHPMDDCVYRQAVLALIDEALAATPAPLEPLPNDGPMLPSEEAGLRGAVEEAERDGYRYSARTVRMLLATIDQARATPAPLDVERLAHKAAEIGFTYGALGRDFEYVLKNVDDMLAAERAAYAEGAE
jgi:hypothetical protein